jgi:hypothetical protein
MPQPWQTTLDASSVALVRQNKPGAEINERWSCRCKFTLGCAAGQLLSEQERVLCDGLPEWDRFATSEQVATLLTAQGHDPSFVLRLQSIHDVAAHRAAASRSLASWPYIWLRSIDDLARDLRLSTWRIYDAARRVGWCV